MRGCSASVSLSFCKVCNGNQLLIICFPRIDNLLKDIKSYVTVWVYHDSMKIFSQNRKFILYTNMCSIKYVSNCCPIYLCADEFFLKKVKCYSTFLLKWLLLTDLNFRYSFRYIHSIWLYFRALFDIVPDNTGPPILVWRDSNEKKKVDIPQVKMYSLRIHNMMKLVHFVIPFYSVSLE